MLLVSETETPWQITTWTSVTGEKQILFVTYGTTIISFSKRPVSLGLNCNIYVVCPSVCQLPAAMVEQLAINAWSEGSVLH
jgi:hypothetical protein